MFRKRAAPGARLETAVKQALGDAPWLQSVSATPDGRVVLVIEADPDDLSAAEARRMDAEATARTIEGVSEVSAVLTAERRAGSESPPPLPTTKRVRKGARLSDAALEQGDAQAPRVALPKVAGVSRILVVASAKGGVGKSTVAVNLAAAMAAAGLKAGLLDADIYGPSLPTMLGTLEAQPETNTDGKLVPVPAHGLQTLSIGYLSDPDTPMIWRGPIVMSAITQMLNDAAWGDPGDPLDILIIDTPPGTGDAQLALAQKVPVDAALLVTTPQDVALADVRRGAAMFAKTAVPVLGVVETMSWFEDPAGNRHHLMGDGGGKRMADALGLPLLAQLPMLQAIREGGDAGMPAALSDGTAKTLFMHLARSVARSLDQLETKPAPEIVFED